MSKKAADTPEKNETPRYDILILPQNPAFNVASQGLRAILNYLQISGFVSLNAEAVAETWTEVYGTAGPTAHELFVKGAYNGPQPLFEQFAIRSGTKATPIPFGAPEEESCYFWISFRGALYPDLTGKVKNKIREILYSRFDYSHRPFTSLPPPAVVPEDEKPIAQRKPEGLSNHRVGTVVEEF